LTDFGFASAVREMNSAACADGRNVAWVAPEILERADTITREADVFAFGMVVIEVSPRASSHLLEMDEWIVCLTSECFLRFSQEGVRSANPLPQSSLQRLQTVNTQLVRRRRKNWV